MFQTNAYDALNLYCMNMNNNNNFYFLNGGLSQLVDRMSKKLSQLRENKIKYRIKKY